MCGILLTSFPITSDDSRDAFASLYRRGPDAQQYVSVNGRSFVHALLSLNGTFNLQPIYIKEISAYLLFNGELYNREVLTAWAGSDTLFLSDMLVNHDIFDVLNLIDGEFVFAVYYLETDTIHVATDLFRTKPIWVGLNPTFMNWGVCSYRATLNSLGLPYAVELGNNSILEIDLKSSRIQLYKDIVQPNFSRSVDTLNDWLTLFDQSILKRVPRSSKFVIPLSSGLDSGLIAYRSKALGLEPYYISVIGSEEPHIIEQRASDLNSSVLSISSEQYLEAFKQVHKTVEPWNYKKHQPNLDIEGLHQDPGSVGLHIVLSEAKRSGCLVSLSGQGADEIYSDYGYRGRSLANISELKGMYPDDMKEIYPWKNLYSGTQRAYIGKDDHVGSSLGMETRYPFLDKSLFYSFLSLAASDKNSYYKGPIGYWIKQLGIPTADRKLGFSANKGLS